MRSCLSCSAPAKPGEKFCGRCGSPLGPEPPGTDTEVSPQASPSGAGGVPSRKVLTVAAVLVVIIIVIAAGYLLLKGDGSVSGTATAGVPSDTTQNASYVIVENEEPVTTVTTVLPITTAVPTTRITTAPTTLEDIICPSDRLECSSACIDARSDSKNCGRCNHACPSGETCISGNCMKACTAGKTSCPDGCFNILTDAKHCGSCINSCPGGLACSNGECVLPATRIQVIE